MYLVLLCSNKLVHYGRIIESTKDICTLAEQCACTKSGTVCRYIEGCIQRMDAREDLKKKSKKINPEGCMLSLRGGGSRGYEGVELGFRIFACNLREAFTRKKRK